MSSEPRPCTDADLPAVLALHERAHGRAADATHWRWKHGRPRAAQAGSFIVTEPDGRAVHYYGGIPTHLVLGAERYVAVQNCDVTTDPERRRRGLLTRTASVAAEAWSAAGVSVVFAIPNERWGSRYQAAGYQAVSRLRLLVRPLRLEAAITRRLGLPTPARLGPLSWAWRRLWRPRGSDVVVSGAVRQLAVELGAELTRAWERVRPSDRVMVDRDAAYLAWRYLDCPSRCYQLLVARRDSALCGWVVVAEPDETGTGAVAELIAHRSDEAARRALLEAAANCLLEQGARSMSAMVPDEPELIGSFRWAGFVRGGAQIAGSAIFINPESSSRVASARWQQWGGDWDVV